MILREFEEEKRKGKIQTGKQGKKEVTQT